ncbi:hypothetical protein [Olleya sp. R77988]|uniref:hypothetical protein n=1 Tax=Olleya sp. R77988 TaxID=3093875 RepID=UPI0037C75440
MKKTTLLLLLFTFCNSIFASSLNNTVNKSSASAINEIKIIRLEYTAPSGASRELILGFTSDGSATDGVDYGFDATVSSPFTNDLNWLIEDNRYVIQGVGDFQETSQYLFGLYSEASGEAKIEVTSLENFTDPINVYIYDALLNTYTNITDTAYTNTIDAGNYTDRFYIAFNEPAQDTVENVEEDYADEILNNNKKLKISYNQGLNELTIKLKNQKNKKNKNKIKKVEIYDVNQNLLQSIENINKKKTTIQLNTDENHLILVIYTKKKTFVKQVYLN